MTTEPNTDPLDHDATEPDTTVRPVMQLWRAAKAASKRQSQERRARVLGHDDLAQRLTAPPLRLSNPARWSGWIPPRTLPEEACTHCGPRGDQRCRGAAHRARLNDSAIRRQLVDIAAETKRREATP
ncbi:MAG TPA: hypothetical protein VFW64_15710 [Pseudonocardiaceae bacterium]|nr:hypothetical protein [Pseudonocardiaceae bacterium]